MARRVLFRPPETERMMVSLSVRLPDTHAAARDARGLEGTQCLISLLGDDFIQGG